MKRQYSNEEIIKAVSNNNSYAGVLKYFGVVPSGGNYRIIKRKIKLLNLDTTHFTGKLWSKGKKFGHKKSIEEYLICGDGLSPVMSSSTLKLRLLKENIKKHKCEQCNLFEWNNQPIALELHHIDGNTYNNTLENLQILCPNCHAQTTNYRGRNKQSSVKLIARRNCKTRQRTVKIKTPIYCTKCFNEIKGNGKTGKCVNCARIRKVENRPTKNELLDLIEKTSYSEVGRMFGVSDNAIRKWLK